MARPGLSQLHLPSTFFFTSLPSLTSFLYCIRDASLRAGQESKPAGGKGASTLLPSPDEPYRIQQRCIKEYHTYDPSGASGVKKAEKPSTSRTHRSHSSLKSIVVFS